MVIDREKLFVLVKIVKKLELGVIIMLGVKGVRGVLRQLVKKEWLRIEMMLGFGGLRVSGRCFVWSVLVKSFIGVWWGGRGRSGGNIGGGGMFRFQPLDIKFNLK